MTGPFVTLHVDLGDAETIASALRCVDDLFGGATKRAVTAYVETQVALGRLAAARSASIPPVGAERGTTGVGGNAAVTHCPAGHPYDDENTYWNRGRRHCKACARRRSREHRDRQAQT